jgi:hypothetical protein
MNEVVVSEIIKNVDCVIDDKVFEFRKYARKSVESVLEMCRVVLEAKTELSDDGDFNRFAQRVGCEGSFLRKCIIIGKKYKELKSNERCLPANWTSLYEIARLDGDIINALVSEGEITPESKGCELKALVANHIQPKSSGTKVKVQNGTHENLQFTCKIDDLSNQYKLTKILAIINQLNEIDCDIEYSDDLMKFIEPQVYGVAA